MSKIEEVRSAMVAAMKAGDKPSKETLSLLLAALKNKAIDKRADLTEEEEVQVILKEIKQTKETLELAPADRTDIIEECQNRIVVLEAFAPKMMDESEITAIIHSVLANLGIDVPTGKDKGRIMKDLMPQVKGKADGKLVNQILMSLMQA
ncbi:MAG: GatB/YqeY domain-containing protein [Eubacteriales bacterium]